MSGRRIGAVLGVVVLGSVLVGCGGGTAGEAGEGPAAPLRLPVATAAAAEVGWNPRAPAWYADGVLTVGERRLAVGPDLDTFVLGATGAYWLDGTRLRFTAADGRTQEVADLGMSEVAVSADHTTLAVVDAAQGPTDRYGTRVRQVVVLDTRTGVERYRTPDEQPDGGADLADLYEETSPLLHGVSDERVFFDGATTDLADGSDQPTSTDADGLTTYADETTTRFPEGYRTGVRQDGDRRLATDRPAYGTGVLSPDRRTLLDTGSWPTPAVAYDARTGAPRAVEAPWDHLVLGGWTDRSTFFGVAEDIAEDDLDGPLQAWRPVTCDTRGRGTVRCTPLGPAVPVDPASDGPAYVLPGGAGAGGM